MAATKCHVGELTDHLGYDRHAVEGRDGGNSPWSAGWQTPEVPENNRWSVRATFTEPGTYVLRALAHDGGLLDYADVTVIVKR